MKRVTTFATRLRELRKEKGLSQSQLSEEVPSAGRSSIAEWELKKREPLAEVVADLAIFFEVSMDYMMGFEE